MFEFVLVLVAKMYSPLTNGADYLRHLFSTSFKANRLLRLGIAKRGRTFYSSLRCCAGSILEDLTCVDDGMAVRPVPIIAASIIFRITRE
jgi:hypothetical protein